MMFVKRGHFSWIPLLVLLVSITAQAGGPPQSWTTRTSNTQQQLNGVAYGNGTFIAVGANGTIISSPDGVTWTSHNSGTTKTLRAITYSPTSYAFVAVGNLGTILYSTDKGATWASNGISSNVDLTAVTSGVVKNGGVKFVAVGSSSKIVTTNNPVLPWGAESLPTSAPQGANLLGVSSSGEGNNSNPLYVVIGSGGLIYSSSDTKNWSALPCGFSGAVEAITHQIGQNFVALAGSYGPGGLAEKLLLIAGNSCTIQAAATNATFSGMTYGDGYEVAVGYHKIMYSRQNSLTDWYAVTQSINTDLKGVAYGGNAFVAVGADGAIYQSTAQQVSSYQGCYTDDASRALPVQLMASGATVETCIAAAKAHNYAYAGLQYSEICFAGNILGYAKVSDGECNTPCKANSAQSCGGAWRNSIHATGVTPPTALSPQYQGCYTDDANRALPVQLISEGATVERCVAAARTRNLKYAGLQFKGQCFAGNTLGYTKTVEAQCNTPCTANTSQTCGGTWRNSIYATGVTPAPSVPTSSYKGCYTDDANRALPIALMSSGATIESCVALAKNGGFAYAGLQFQGQCYAGNTLGHTKVSDSECNTPCTANTAEKCGGGWRNSIYSTH